MSTRKGKSRKQEEGRRVVTSDFLDPLSACSAVTALHLVIRGGTDDRVLTLCCLRSLSDGALDSFCLAGALGSTKFVATPRTGELSDSSCAATPSLTSRVANATPTIKKIDDDASRRFRRPLSLAEEEFRSDLAAWAVQFWRCEVDGMCWRIGSW